MIKTTELRIGNLCRDRLTGSYLRVFSLTENVGFDVVHRESYPLPDGWQAEYLPLTPEILEKCSGPYSSLSWYRAHDEIGFQIGELQVRITGGSVHDTGAFIVRRGQGIHDIPKMEYLHQLQNLYFALTGEELNIKL